MSALSGKRILVTRPRSQSAALLAKLAELGADAIPLPVIEIEPLADNGRLDTAIHSLGNYRWVIFTSVNGVAAFWARLTACGMDKNAFSGVQVAAIGPVTAQALRDRGVEPAFIPSEFIAEAIAAGLGDIRGARILRPRADIARKALATELEMRGAVPDEIAVYRTAPATPDPEVLAELRRGFDAVLFTSASTVHSFMRLLQEQALEFPASALVACIGPITADAARAHGLEPQVVAAEYTTDGLLNSLLDFYHADET